MNPDLEKRVPREILEELIEEGTEAFRGILEKLFNVAMQLERSEFLGAEAYERTASRRGYRNGLPMGCPGARGPVLGRKGRRSVVRSRGPCRAGGTGLKHTGSRARPVASARSGLIPCRRWRTQTCDFPLTVPCSGFRSASA